jgi:hypothetical protein
MAKVRTLGDRRNNGAPSSSYQSGLIDPAEAGPGMATRPGLRAVWCPSWPARLLSAANPHRRKRGKSNPRPYENNNSRAITGVGGISYDLQHRGAQKRHAVQTKLVFATTTPGGGVGVKDSLGPQIPHQPSSDGKPSTAFVEDAPRLAPEPSRGLYVCTIVSGSEERGAASSGDEVWGGRSRHARSGRWRC